MHTLTLKTTEWEMVERALHSAAVEVNADTASVRPAEFDGTEFDEDRTEEAAAQAAGSQAAYWRHAMFTHLLVDLQNDIHRAWVDAEETGETTATLTGPWALLPLALHAQAVRLRADGTEFRRLSREIQNRVERG